MGERRREREGRTARIPVRLLLAGALGGAVLGPVGWLVSDHLERDDDFCVSCHLEPGIPLHRDNRADFEARPPVSLAAAHAAHGNEGGEDGAFRCIDCHGGVGALGRARVKLLSVKDAFWYLVGRFEEPEGMRWPLWDRDCTKCHDSFGSASRASFEAPAFHGLAVHNHRLGVDCVACHLSHERGGLQDHDFLHPQIVRTQCARCHPEYEESAR